MPSRRYTDDDLRAALADPAVRTVADLCRVLGLVPRGANYQTLRAVTQRLGLQLDEVLASRQCERTDDEDDPTIRTGSRSAGIARRRQAEATYSDEQLLEALTDPRVDSYHSLCEALGLRPHSTTHRRLRKRAASLGVPIPEVWSRPGVRPRRDGDGTDDLPAPYEETAFRQAIAGAASMADAIRGLGDTPTATTYLRANASVAAYGVDTAHFQPAKAGARRREVPDDEFFVRGRTRSGQHLKRRLLRGQGGTPCCARCGRATWEGEPIPLEIDHIDGDRRNNLRENLRLLCPNCHALTPTYRGRNIGRYRERTVQPEERSDAPG